MRKKRETANVLKRAWQSVVAVTSVVLCVATARGATVPESVPEHSLVICKMETGERGTVFSANFAPVVVYQGYGGFAFTGAPGRYAVLVVPSGDAPIQTLFVTITPGSGPGPAPVPVPVPPDPTPVPPDPTPVPEPTGFALEVKNKAAAINDKANARALSDVFRTIHARAGAELTTVQAVYDATKTATRGLGLPPAKWNTFNAWLSGELTARAQTMDTVRSTFHEIAEGLEAAGR